jgi:(p)ppGpp synthase/HD superfamily hydrolase
LRNKLLKRFGIPNLFFIFVRNNKIMRLYDLENWCVEQHKNTNHFYDKYLPYQFHLQMVVQAFEDFKHLLPKDLITTEEEEYHNIWVIKDITNHTIRMACWGHDLIEDTRTSYNDVQNRLGVYVADIVYAVSNEKGKTRKERANDKYYEGIRNTKGAVFVKLCDRIANVQYSKMTKSSMFKKYKEETPEFISRLGFNLELGNGVPSNWDGVENVKYLRPMVDYLVKLFSEE